MRVTELTSFDHMNVGVSTSVGLTSREATSPASWSSQSGVARRASSSTNGSLKDGSGGARVNGACGELGATKRPFPLSWADVLEMKASLNPANGIGSDRRIPQLILLCL